MPHRDDTFSTLKLIYGSFDQNLMTGIEGQAMKIVGTYTIEVLVPQ